MRVLVKRLIDERASSWEKMKGVIERSESEERDLSAEEQRQVEEWNKELESLDARIDELIQLEERNKRIEEQRQRFEIPAPGSDTPEGQPTIAEQFRALAAGDIKSFDIDLRGVVPHYDPRTGIVETRDLTVGTASAGGDTVPTSFVRRLYEHVVEQSAIRRTNVTVIQTASGENLEFPKTTGLATAALIAEAAAITESDPTFAKVTLGAFKYAVASQVSFELLQDTGVDLEGFLARDMGRAVADDMGEDFVVGDGASKPNGVVTASTLGVTGGTGVSGAFTADELIDLQYSVIEAYANRGTWMMQRATEGDARKLKGSDNNYLWQPGLQVGAPNLLLGRPIVNDPFMPAVGLSNKSVLFGDFSTYLIRDAGSLRIQRSDDFAFLNDLATFKAVWRSDGDLLDATGSIKHFVGGAT